MSGREYSGGWGRTGRAFWEAKAEADYKADIQEDVQEVQAPAN